jgi:hypothetical protein
MIWLPKRIKQYKGRVNCVLAFKYVGFQFIIDETTGMNGWVVDLIPGVCVARNAWVRFGGEFRWLIFTFCLFLTTPKFTEGIIWERDFLAKRSKYKGE